MIYDMIWLHQLFLDFVSRRHGSDPYIRNIFYFWNVSLRTYFNVRYFGVRFVGLYV